MTDTRTGADGASHDTSNHTSDDTSRDEDRRLGTIRSLLAKAEATEFPEEAETFFAKASELISRWAIDEAMLWDGADRSGREQPDELQLRVYTPYLAQKAVLIGAVADANGCRAIRLTSGAGSKSEIVSIVGFPSDLRWVETLVTSLMVQLTAAMLALCPLGVNASASASWRRSFIIGYAEEVGSRLETDRAAAAADRPAGSSGLTGDRTGDGRAGGDPSDAASAVPAVHSAAVVLASRAEEVGDDFRRRYPRVRSSWASSGRSATGRQAGQRAGREAALTRGGIGGRRSVGPG